MPTVQIALGIEMGMSMMTPFSHGFNTCIISVYQIWGNCRRELWAVAMLPKRKESQDTEGLQARSLLQAPGTEQASHRATLPLPERQQCLLCLKASTEVSQNQTKVLFHQIPQLASLPCPLLGTTWIRKLQYLLPMIKMFTWANNDNKKKNQKELLPQAWVPSAKTWILLNASPAGAETDSHWIFFTHTLKPLIGTLACQKMAGQLTTAQLLWLSWFTPQVTMQMRNAGFLSFTPITQLLTSPK